MLFFHHLLHRVVHFPAIAFSVANHSNLRFLGGECGRNERYAGVCSHTINLLNCFACFDHPDTITIITGIAFFRIYRYVWMQELGRHLFTEQFVSQQRIPELGDVVIDPVTEDVTITVGTSSLVIPANSFQAKKRRQGVEFQGWVDGALVRARIVEVRPYTFRYSVEAQKVDLTDSPIPLTFSLRIGTDVGVTTIPLHGYLRSGGKHDLLAERRYDRRAIRK